MADHKKPLRYRWRDSVIATALPTRAKYLARVLADRMKPDDLACWPGLTTLCKDTAYTTKTVIEARRDLVKIGVLRYEQGGPNRPNHYFGLFSKGSTGATPVLESREGSNGAAPSTTGATPAEVLKKTQELPTLADGSAAGWRDELEEQRIKRQ